MIPAPRRPQHVPAFVDDDAMRKALREPFPKEQIGRLPRTEKRPALDFVGHAAVTDRLNAVAPDATWTVDELFTQGGVCWIRGTMTIGGVSRPEYGDGKDPKEAIGNFIRRGAMRFGVALDLWSREELTANLKDPASPLAAPLVTRSADEQVSSERSTPADADGGLASEAGAPPILSSGTNAQTGETPSPAKQDERPGDSSSAAPDGAGTEAGGARQEPSGHGEGPAGSEGSPQPPSRRDQLWKQLVEFAGGSEAKARTEINTRLKTGWTRGNTEHIPEDDIEKTLIAVLQEAG